MQITVDSISKSLPHYLTQPQKDGLVKAFSEFPSASCNYYSSLNHEGVLQGDIWTGFDIFRFTTGERQSKRGMVLSNSCDIDSRNTRVFPTRLAFASMLKLSAYKEYLLKNGFSDDRVERHFRDVRHQIITSIFYLPQGPGLETEYIVLLDHVHNVPLAHFEKSVNSSKVLTLSQVGFYIFVMKLSIHLCRMHEGEVRTHV